MASNGKRMVKEDLINYLEAVQTNYPDPSDIGGGTDFTATNGLLLQEIEGENYLGIDPSANIKGQLVFTTTKGNLPAITINTGISTNTDIKFDYVDDSGSHYNHGRLRYVQGVTGHFELGSMVNGDYATVKTPNANTILDDGEWPTTRTIALGAKVGSTTYYAGNDGLITLPNSGVEKKLYLVTLYMNNLDSAVSFLTDNDYGLSAINPTRPDFNKPIWDGSLYGSGDLSADLTADEKTKIANILLHIPVEPYDTKIGGIVTNYTNNTIILSGTFKSYGELSLFYLTDNNGSLSMTTEDISIVDGSALRTQLDTSVDMSFSIIQIL